MNVGSERHLVQVPLSRFARVQSEAVKVAKEHGHDMGPFETGKYEKVRSECCRCHKRIVIRWDGDHDHDPVVTKELTSECKGE